MLRLLVVASGFFAGCLGPQLVPLALPPVRYVQQGFSFVPLDEPGWMVAQYDPALTVLGHEGTHSGDLVWIQAGIMPLDEGQSFDSVLEEFSRGLSPAPRHGFEVTANSVEAIPAIGEKCVRSHMLSKNSEARVLEVWMVVCPDPSSPDAALILSYAAGYPDGARDPESDAKAAKLLDSFKLSADQPGGT